jgi:hypothetical protein
VGDPLEKLAEFNEAIRPALEERLARLKKRPPDPERQPVTHAVVAAYMSRLSIQIDLAGKGVTGLREQIAKHPNLSDELQEIETWILRRKRAESVQPLIQEYEDTMGDFLVSTGRSYTRTKEMLRKVRQKIGRRGAPNKRPETLNILDARVVNGWSYSQLASQMCDCGAIRHTSHCGERIRKRIKELQEFLDRYAIVYRVQS